MIEGLVQMMKANPKTGEQFMICEYSTNDERPFPFRRTVEPAQYASRLAQVTNSTFRTRRPVSHPAV